MEYILTFSWSFQCSAELWLGFMLYLLELIIQHFYLFYSLEEFVLKHLYVLVSYLPWVKKGLSDEQVCVMKKKKTKNP